MNNSRDTDVPPTHSRGDPVNPMANYKITPDEMRVLDECNWESFTQRSLPLGIALGTATLMAVRRGFLRPNLRFGAAPKVTIAAAVGYFLGKLSYHRTCAEKLMALPGSRIGQMLRDIKENKGATSPITMYGATQDDIYSDAGPGSSLDIDTDRPIFSGDDTYDSGSTSSSEEHTYSKPSSSYDDLRKRNREQYTDVSRGPYRMDASREPLGAPPPPLARSEPRPTRSSTNKYGDIVD